MADLKKMLKKANNVIEPLGFVIEVDKEGNDTYNVYIVDSCDCGQYDLFTEGCAEKDLGSEINTAVVHAVVRAKELVKDKISCFGKSTQVALLAEIYLSWTDAKQDEFLEMIEG